MRDNHAAIRPLNDFCQSALATLNLCGEGTQNSFCLHNDDAWSLVSLPGHWSHAQSFIQLFEEKVQWQVSVFDFLDLLRYANFRSDNIHKKWCKVVRVRKQTYCSFYSPVVSVRFSYLAFYTYSFNWAVVVQSTSNLRWLKKNEFLMTYYFLLHLQDFRV